MKHGGEKALFSHTDLHYFVHFKLNYPDTAGFKLDSDIFNMEAASDSFLLSTLCDAHRRVLSSFVSFDLKCSFRCVS